ncbi:MAG: PKD domain-containing protein [Acidobacteria bacterium]|nr:PKD domain-containing protein [Acidobacteriota bacterium]
MSTTLFRPLGAVAAALLVALVGGAACTVHKTEAPSLTGPSEFALSVVVSAFPDSLNQDGASQSAIVVSVRDAYGQPKSGVLFRADISVAGTIVDYGSLSARTVVTGADGKASTVYTAPPAAANATFTTVSIVMTTIGSDSQTESHQAVTIRLTPPGVILPVAGAPLAQFDVTPKNPSAKSPVTFDGSASCGSMGNGNQCTTASQIVTYAWDFGDGSTASGALASHTFALQQTYSVALTVTNDRGVSATSRQSIAVGAGLLPTASFTFSPAAPGAGEKVYFNASASTAGAGHRLVSYNWTSGDGTIGLGVTPSYAFPRQGKYKVTLIVVDEAGQQSVPASLDVDVGTGTPAPTAKFTISPTDPVNNVTDVVFDASTSTTAQGQTITHYVWNFGDNTGTEDDLANPITKHRFLTANTFTINLTVTDSAGRTSSTSLTVKVN